MRRRGSLTAPVMSPDTSGPMNGKGMMCENRVRSGFPGRAPWRSLFLRVRSGCTELPVAVTGQFCSVAAAGVSRDATTCRLPTCPAPPSHHPPTLPSASPPEAGDSITVHIPLTPRTVLKFLFCGILQLAVLRGSLSSEPVCLNAPLVRGSARIPPRLACGGDGPS